MGLVAAGFLALGVFVGSRLFRTPRAQPFNGNPQAQTALGISPRELTVLHELAAGQSNKEKVARISRMETRALVKQTNAIDKAEGLRCLAVMLDLTEYLVATTAAQTNAWTSGAVEALKAILQAQPKADCHEALGGQLRAQWATDTLRPVDTAMQGTRRSVLLLPMPMLLDERLVNELRAKGYQVRTPG